MLKGSYEIEVKEKHKVVIFGASEFASLMTTYLQLFSVWEISAYVVDEEFIKAPTYLGKPLVSLQDVATLFPPNQYDAFIAVGYNQMGDIRRKLFQCAKEIGYYVLNFVHPKSVCYATSIGEGNILLESSVISLRSKIGDGNLIWNGCQLGHDLEVGDFNTFCAGCIVSGNTHIGNNCFFGVGSATRNNISIASYTFLGMREQLNHNSSNGEAYISTVAAKPQKMSSHKIMKFFELSE